jgi:predicted 2-oxoglutarate/Fe(II)-dependent dioxygenase YbiX
MFDLNPIDVLKQRKLKTLPPHFSKMKISDSELFEGVEDWVKTKLKGRYCLVRSPGIDEGGNLKFDLGPHRGDRYHECAEIRPRGSIIVFPSHVYHQVTPVTKGTRYSLVAWNLGYPFK